MPLVLKYKIESGASCVFSCTLRGYLNNKKAVCVVIQHRTVGDASLSSFDTCWARLVQECTNDTDMQFGTVLKYEDYVWIENISDVNDRNDIFEHIEFDIVQPKDAYRLSQEIVNPKRRSISQHRVEELIGERWDANKEPVPDAWSYVLRYWV